jgi:hypothetical protein
VEEKSYQKRRNGRGSATLTRSSTRSADGDLIDKEVVRRGFHRPGGNGYQARPGGRPRLWIGVPREWTPRPQMVSFTQDVDVPTETCVDLDTARGHGFLRPKFTPSDRCIHIQSQTAGFTTEWRYGRGQACPPKDGVERIRASKWKRS